MTQDKTYYIREGGKTLKQFFDRFYCIPKDLQLTKEQLEFLKANAIYPIDEDIKNGRDGYIVKRGRRKKILTFEQQIEILESDLPYRKLSEKYNCSVGTICKIKKGIY